MTLILAKIATLAALLFVASISCGPPPGKAVCARFEEVVADARSGKINNFEFRKHLGKLEDKAEKAEPEIAKAAAKLAQAANTVSDLRVQVAIEAMNETCVRFGYLEVTFP